MCATAHIQVRIVRLWFKLNNYKSCKAIFDTFEKQINHHHQISTDFFRAFLKWV